MSLPIACNFGALTLDQQVKYKELRNQLKAVEYGTEELPNGYAFSYPNEDDVLKNLMDWVILERLCCPFLEFTLIINNKQPIVLTLSGSSESIKMLVKMEFGL